MTTASLGVLLVLSGLGAALFVDVSPAAAASVSLTVSASSVAPNTPVTYIATFDVPLIASVEFYEPTTPTPTLLATCSVGSSSPSMNQCIQDDDDTANNGDGVATFVTEWANVGSTPEVYAAYTSGGRASGITSNTVPVSVATPPPPTPAITLAASAATITTGQSVTLSGNVTLGGQPDSDVAVTLTNGGNSLDTTTTDSNGDYEWSTSSLPTSPSTGLTIQASVSVGGSSVTSTVTVIVNAPVVVDATTTLAASAATITTAQNVVLTATVTAGGQPVTTGTVTFYDVTSGQSVPGGCASLPPDSAGEAICTVDALTAGDHTFEANYSGPDPDSSTPQVSVDVSPAISLDQSNAVVSVSPAAITTTGSVTLTAVVTDQQTGQPLTNGAVTFYDESTQPPDELGGRPITADSSGDYVLSGQSDLPVGVDTIEAHFTGPTSQPSSGSAQVTVLAQAATPTVGLTLSSASILLGQSTTLNATVVSAVAGVTPTGTVTFDDAAGNPIGTVALSSDDTASISYTPSAVGQLPLTVTYNGDAADNSASSPATDLTVSASGTTTVALFEPLVPLYGQPVTLSSAVTSVLPLSGTPTGTVSYYFGAVGTGDLLCQAAVSSGCVTTSLPAGNDAVIAVYGGDAGHTGSQGSVIVPVGLASTTTSLTVSAPSTPVGQAVTLVANVVGVLPTGTVTFSTGSTVLCSDVTLLAGSATCTTSQLPAGASVPLTAVYSGDANNGSSTGSATTTIVDTTTTTVSATPSSTAVGESVQLSATVAAGSSTSGTPSGSVSFYLGKVGAANLLCTATLSAGSASCPTTTLPVGTDTVVAQYGGDSDHAASSASTAVTVTLATATTTVLSVSTNPSAQGESVTLSAAVTGDDPTGTVAFSVGSTTLCSAATLVSGVATCTTSALPAGADALSAVYSGDAANLSSTGIATATVVAVPNFRCWWGWGGWGYESGDWPYWSTSGGNGWNCDPSLLSDPDPADNLNLLSGSSGQMTIVYNGQSPIGTGADAPLAVLFTETGQVVALLPVSVTSLGYGNGYGGYGYGYGNGNAELLTVSVPASLATGIYAAEITAYDGYGDVDQYVWSVTVGPWSYFDGGVGTSNPSTPPYEAPLQSSPATKSDD